MSTNIITINRGDTYEFELTICDGANGNYQLKGNDAVYFALVEPNAPIEHALIWIKVTADGVSDPEKYASLSTIQTKYGPEQIITFKLPSEATENLLSGVYYYTIKLEQNHQDVYNANETVQSVSTIIKRTKFVVLN